MGVVPVHDPGAAVNLCPSRAEPAIDGGAVLDAGRAATALVAAETAAAAPAEFVALTRTLIVAPTSADVSK